MDESQKSILKKTRRRRALGLVVVLVGVILSWAVLAESILQIDRKYAFWIPVYLLLIAGYWVPAWIAIANRMEEIPEAEPRWAKGVGCMVAAFLVFLLICVVLATFLLD